jgi:hypothetical protein
MLSPRQQRRVALSVLLAAVALFVGATTWPWLLVHWAMGGRYDCRWPGAGPEGRPDLACQWMLEPSAMFRWRAGLRQTILCADLQRWGNAGDQGWSVCVDDRVESPPTVATVVPAGTEAAAAASLPRRCVVYSFGINHQWSFDLAAVAKGCEVHAFDPTIIVLPHGSRQADGQALCSAARRSSSYRRERGYSQGEDTRRCLPNPSSEIHFHDYGLYGADAHLANVGDVKTLRTIMSELGHAHVDVLKIDIEGSEWSLFADDDSDGTPEQMAQSVSQVMMEIHMHPDELAVQLAAMPGAPGSDYQPQSAVGQLLSLRPPALNFYRRALNRMVSLGFGANPTSISLAFTFPNCKIYLPRQASDRNMHH